MSQSDAKIVFHVKPESNDVNVTNHCLRSHFHFLLLCTFFLRRPTAWRWLGVLNICLFVNPAASVRVTGDVTGSRTTGKKKKTWKINPFLLLQLGKSNKHSNKFNSGFNWSDIRL